MTDKQIIEYKHIKCTKDDCCRYCGSIYCGYVDDIENLEKAYKAKEQECEELKDLNTRLDNQRETYWKGYQKLKQTLTEIKEIAEKIADECELEPYGACALKAKEQILQKISECEGNDE